MKPGYVYTKAIFLQPIKVKYKQICSQTNFFNFLRSQMMLCTVLTYNFVRMLLSMLSVFTNPVRHCSRRGIEPRFPEFESSVAAPDGPRSYMNPILPLPNLIFHLFCHASSSCLSGFVSLRAILHPNLIFHLFFETSSP